MKFALASSIFTLVMFVTYVGLSHADPIEEGTNSLDADLPVKTTADGNPG